MTNKQIALICAIVAYYLGKYSAQKWDILADGFFEWLEHGWTSDSP